jgi:hypothetical protein
MNLSIRSATGVAVRHSGCIQTAHLRRNEDVMDKRQILETPHVEAQDVPEESTLQRQNAALHRQNAALQRQVAALHEDNEDLRASALWWKALYEEAQRRCVDLEISPKARASTRVDPCFTMRSSPRAHAPRPGVTTRPL